MKLIFVIFTKKTCFLICLEKEKVMSIYLVAILMLFYADLMGVFLLLSERIKDFAD